jgi:hypothetical protein
MQLRGRRTTQCTKQPSPTFVSALLTPKWLRFFNPPPAAPTQNRKTVTSVTNPNLNPKMASFFQPQTRASNPKSKNRQIRHQPESWWGGLQAARQPLTRNGFVFSTHLRAANPNPKNRHIRHNPRGGRQAARQPSTQNGFVFSTHPPRGSNPKSKTPTSVTAPPKLASFFHRRHRRLSASIGGQSSLPRIALFAFICGPLPPLN